MEHVPEILKALAEYGLSLPLLIILFMMYLMGVKSGMFPAFWKREIEQEISIKELYDKMAQLHGYFNHDTTSFHEDTHKKLDVLLEKEEEEAKERTEIRDTVKDIKTKLNEFDKYGIKTRKSIKA